MKSTYDVVIVGAGMVGATLAAALSQSKDLSIALIDAQQIQAFSENEAPDYRVVALTQASEVLLQNLGIWELLMPSRLSAFTDMHVWESKQSQLHFDSADIGAPHLGHIIENRHLQYAAIRCCQTKSNIDLLCPAKPKSLTENTLRLESGEIITAKLIVGADGAHSLLREWKNIEVKGWDYQQSALVCSVITEHPHQNTAWQRFLPEGPLALLPLVNPHECSIVWSNTTQTTQELLEMDEQGFIKQLTSQFDHTLGQVASIGHRAQFPLKLRHAEHYVEQGFALVGDAAHTIHPLAGQGVNIGLLDAATLAEIVLDAQAKKRDIASLQTLTKYQRRRKGDNIAMQLTMDAFKRVFGTTLPPIKWARQFGLKTVNETSWLKQLFMHQASGHRFANPKLSSKQFEQ
jgi:2-octaprenylphenol hydroxylase